MSERVYYCFCADNCKFETMTKEQILAAIAQAAETGLVFDPDAAIVSKVKESNAGGSLTFWAGTRAQFNALQTVDKSSCMYIITDDTTDADIAEAIKQAAAAAENATAAAAAALPKTGGAIDGTLMLNGDIILQEGVNYGTEAQRPAAGVKGRIWFQVVESE